MVVLDPVEDLGLGGVGVDLPGGGDTVGVVALELRPADLEDPVGVEVLESPVIDVVAYRPRPSGHSGRGARRDLVIHSTWSSMATFARSTAAPGAGDRRPRGSRPGVGRRDDVVEEPVHAGAGPELDLEPRPDLRFDGPRSVAAEERRRLLEPCGDRSEAVRERREVAGEEREEQIAQR